MSNKGLLDMIKHNKHTKKGMTYKNFRHSKWIKKHAENKF